MDRRSFLMTGGGAVAATALTGAPAAQASPGHRPWEPVVRFTILSDIQGDLGDFGTALDDIAHTTPDSAGLGIAGDITPRGYDFEYAQVRAVLDRHPHPRRLALAIGNHEFYVPKWRDPDTLSQPTWPNGVTEDSLFRSFFRFAGRNSVYAETSFGGIPVLCLGTERYAKYHDPKLWDEVWLSDTQFTWLERRLAHWARWRKPVMVLTHHPLPDTVSGTRNKLYLGDYLQAGRLLSVLGRYPDVFLFSGHTHWDLTLADWSVRRVVPGTGNPEGFPVINTAAVQTGWKDDGKGGEVSLGGTFNQGLQVEVGPRTVVVKARDFAAGRWLKQITIPLHNTW